MSIEIWNLLAFLAGAALTFGMGWRHITQRDNKMVPVFFVSPKGVLAREFLVEKDSPEEACYFGGEHTAKLAGKDYTLYTLSSDYCPIMKQVGMAESDADSMLDAFLKEMS